MTTTATVALTTNGWVVNVEIGSSITTRGPYKWKWVANIVKWLENNEH